MKRPHLLGAPARGREARRPDEIVPVETFETALGWLHAQPEVDPERVFTFGVSRGGEMALWLAAAHPDLVAGAIAPVGAGVIVCGYPVGVAWLRGGAPLVEECAPSAIGSPVNQIDVTAIDGPVVLVCGTHDKVWNACDGLDDIVERRGDASDTLATRVDRAGHGSNLPPYLPMPFSADTGPSQIGATREAQKHFWDDVIAVLGRGE